MRLENFYNGEPSSTSILSELILNKVADSDFALDEDFELIDRTAK